MEIEEGSSIINNQNWTNAETHLYILWSIKYDDEYDDCDRELSS